MKWDYVYILGNLVNFTAFPTREQAAAYEKYLKSGSGTTFRHKHLVPKKEEK